MAEFYFTAAIANGYEYRNTPDNYRHFLMELPVNKEELTYILRKSGLSLTQNPVNTFLKLRIFIYPASMQKDCSRKPKI